MNMRSPVNNYFRPATGIGIQQKVRSRKAFDLPGGILLWKSVGKACLWGLPLVLALNLLCSTAIQSRVKDIAALEKELAAVERNNILLRAEKAQLSSPESIKVAAAEKLLLYVPAAGQIQRM